MPTSDNESNNNMDDNKDYDLYIEKIVEKPWKKIRRFIMKIVKIAASAAVFGFVAALVFAFFSPWAEKINEEEESDTAISFTMDEYTTEPTSEEESTQPIEEIVQSAINENELTIDDYNTLHACLSDVAAQGNLSLVTVISVVSTVDWFDNIYEKNGDSVGVIIAEDAARFLILTSYDAIIGADNVRVGLKSGNEVEAHLIKGDANTGLAVISVERTQLNAVDLDKMVVAELANSYIVEQGDPVIAIGKIFGYNDTMNYGIATGVKNVVQEADASFRIINTNIIGSHDGTGVLINLNGEVVGIVTSKYSTDENLNVVTAYSISDLKLIMQQLSNGLDIGYCGIYGQSVTQSMQTNNGIPKGVYVTSTIADSPAFVSGIQSGDIITGINDTAVTSIKEYQELLYSYRPGDVIIVKAMRLGRDGYIEIDFEVTLGIQPN